ncbi:hypothetical protein BDK51DRAFT_46873 [Blyttiomyces helicus]|uniref:C-type lectin domain-containing protein n=1 Tax=Blyttiomyces helicus TaxID=388810 RepID=A0A4P9WF00_9FUNG|nr:hypothetical protein BDK51DRAFT_46873 [Blyttiomyces helicus]|eukprot:RKO91309.1 hypothetical protein BDK51DRAFT_46873 [Blyttiomyces helicus]
MKLTLTSLLAVAFTGEDGALGRTRSPPPSARRRVRIPWPEPSPAASPTPVPSPPPEPSPTPALSRPPSPSPPPRPDFGHRPATDLRRLVCEACYAVPVSHFRLSRIEECIEITVSSLVSYQEIFCDFTAWSASLTQNGAWIGAIGSGRNSTSWHWAGEAEHAPEDRHNIYKFEGRELNSRRRAPRVCECSGGGGARLGREVGEEDESRQCRQNRWKEEGARKLGAMKTLVFIVRALSLPCFQNSRTDRKSTNLLKKNPWDVVACFPRLPSIAPTTAFRILTTTSGLKGGIWCAEERHFATVLGERWIGIFIEPRPSASRRASSPAPAPPPSPAPSPPTSLSHSPPAPSPPAPSPPEPSPLTSSPPASFPPPPPPPLSPVVLPPPAGTAPASAKSSAARNGFTVAAAAVPALAALAFL